MRGGVLVGAALALSLAGTRARAADAPKEGTVPEDSPVAFAAVDPSDGIDADEAKAIAWQYFLDQYGDCGAPGDERRKGRTWVFSVHFGAVGEKLHETIKVDAKTGGVWTQSGPRYRTLAAFREALAYPAPTKR